MGKKNLFSKKKKKKHNNNTPHETRRRRRPHRWERRWWRGRGGSEGDETMARGEAADGPRIQAIFSRTRTAADRNSERKHQSADTRSDARARDVQLSVMLQVRDACNVRDALGPSAGTAVTTVASSPPSPRYATRRPGPPPRAGTATPGVY